MKKTAQLSLLLVGMISVTLPVHSQATPVTGVVKPEETYQEIGWPSLAPELDVEVYKKYRSGKLSQGELHSYMDAFHNTPVKSLDGRNIRMTGYLLPQNIDKDGVSTDFLFVRKVASWSHTDQVLKPNKAALVSYPKGMKFQQSTLVRYQVSGVIKVGNYSVEDTETFYKIKATDIQVNRRRFNEYD